MGYWIEVDWDIIASLCAMCGRMRGWKRADERCACERHLYGYTIEDGIWFVCHLIWGLVGIHRALAGECLGIYGLRDFTISSTC